MITQRAYNSINQEIDYLESIGFLSRKDAYTIFLFNKEMLEDKIGLFRHSRFHARMANETNFDEKQSTPKFRYFAFRRLSRHLEDINKKGWLSKGNRTKYDLMMWSMLSKEDRKTLEKEVWGE